jgi:hypothetical protein
MDLPLGPRMLVATACKLCRRRAANAGLILRTMQAKTLYSGDHGVCVDKRVRRGSEWASWACPGRAGLGPAAPGSAGPGGG